MTELEVAQTKMAAHVDINLRLTLVVLVVLVVELDLHPAPWLVPSLIMLLLYIIEGIDSLTEI